jgi:zinc protease
MRALRDQPVADAELQLAKDSLVNSFVFGFADAHAVVAQRMQFDFFAYPPDYLARYRERIAAVTAEDVQRVARRYLEPSRQQVVIVGAPDETTAPLEGLGLPVKRLTAEDLR